MFGAVQAVAAPPADALAGSVPGWVGTWAHGSLWRRPAAHHPHTRLLDAPQIVHTSIPGKQIRIRFTNEFGTQPLHIGVATVALSAGGAN